MLPIKQSRHQLEWQNQIYSFNATSFYTNSFAKDSVYDIAQQKVVVNPQHLNRAKDQISIKYIQPLSFLFAF